MASTGRMTRAERRGQLKAIGRVLFAERGYAATSVEEIAQRAGVSKPLVYGHFGGKDGLYREIVDREVAGLLAMIVDALEEAEHPRDAVEQAADGFLRYIESERDGFRILVRDAPMGTAEGSLPSLLGDVAAHVDTILAEQFAEHGFDPGSAPLYSRALVGMVALVGEWWLQVGEPPRREVAAHLVNLAWNGLKALDPDPVAGLDPLPTRSELGDPPAR